MADTTDTSTNTQTQTGSESSLSNWAGPYVTDMLGKGWALSDQPYQAYTGPLTAGQSDIQNQAFSGVAGLAVPQNMGAFQTKSFTDQNVAQQYMNPYVQQAIQPQLDELRRQAAISRNKTMGQLSKAGAYGGSRSALADAEITRGMLANMAGITGKGYSDAYNAAMQQFNAEQTQGQTAQNAANEYGLAALQKQGEFGAAQRAIEQEGITADRLQFEEERDFPYKQVQYMQSLLQGLPIAAQSYSYQEPSALSKFLDTSSQYEGLLDSIIGAWNSGSTDSNG